MKNLLVLGISLIFAGTASAQDQKEVIRLSEPVQQTQEFEVFGSELEYDNLEPITLSQVINRESNDGEIILKTSVAQVCQKKGCFFIAQDGDYNARITFKDYGFFIPTDSGGKEVILVGEFSVKTLTEEQAKHYAEDAGKDPDQIKGEQKEYSVVATSIIVPKTK